jgi:Protein of unknown function (DUF4038)
VALPDGIRGIRDVPFDTGLKTTPEQAWRIEATCLVTYEPAPGPGATHGGRGGSAAARPTAGPDRAGPDPATPRPTPAEWVVPCYWAGGSTWRVRFRTKAPGSYRLRFDVGGRSGTATVEVTAEEAGWGDGWAPEVRRSPNGRHLETSAGEPFLWLADTWWYALCDRAGLAESFAGMLRSRREQGFSVIQLVAGLYPEVEAFDPLGESGGRWPWTPGFAALDPDWWDAADERVLAIAGSGLVPAVVGAWSYYLLDMGEQAVSAHWRQILARWAALPVVWCIAGEAGLPHYPEIREPGHERTVERLCAGWLEIARRVRRLDPYRRPVTVHPCPAFQHFSSTDVFSDPSVLDLVWLQTGHADRAAVPSSLGTLERELRERSDLPVVNSEVCYEGIAAGSPATLQRFLFWSHVLSGAAGHTYGAQGLWAFRDPADPGPGNMWGETGWREAFELPGARQLGLGAELLRRLPWQRLRPAPWSVSPHATPERRIYPYAAACETHRVAYFPAASMLALGIGISLELAEIWLHDLGERPWRVLVTNPRTGEVAREHDATAGPDGSWRIPGGELFVSLPTLEDWVVVCERR